MAAQKDALDKRVLSRDIGVLIARTDKDFQLILKNVPDDATRAALAEAHPETQAGLPSDQMAIFICLMKGCTLVGEAEYSAHDNMLSFAAAYDEKTTARTTHVMIVPKKDDWVVCNTRLLSSVACGSPASPFARMAPK